MGEARQLHTARRFVHERWLPGPHAHRVRRERRLRRFLTHELPRADFYREFDGAPLAALPVVDKATVLANFAAFNRHRITLEQARAVATEAERTRDFTPTIATPEGPVTVGLSSGTTGRPGIFLIGEREHPLWAGTIMAQVLHRRSLATMARRPLRVVLFLRANSNLYESLGGGRVHFEFRDTTRPLTDLHAPDIVVGPPSVLVRAAQRQPHLRPLQVVAAAETLEPDDEAIIADTWGSPVGQIYQATEGLLAVTCPLGTLHLNEGMVHIEAEWLDEVRFTPIVTDFTRTTQFVVRYRLDDVLEAQLTSCACGRPGRPLARIQGRADDVLWLRRSGSGVRIEVWPDVLRHAIGAAGEVSDYRLRQDGERWHVATTRPHEADVVRRAVAGVAARLGATAPEVASMPWPQERFGDKRRRISRANDGAHDGAHEGASSE